MYPFSSVYSENNLWKVAARWHDEMLSFQPVQSESYLEQLRQNPAAIGGNEAKHGTMWRPAINLGKVIKLGEFRRSLSLVEGNVIA